ncbi:MAG: MATE family efflux transporter [Bryobacteraceae bacterium]
MTTAVSTSVMQALRREFRPMLSLAGPVVLAELGWMSMTVVDTIMVGRLGAEAIGAVSIGSILFYSVAIFGMGLLLGLDTLVSQAFGAGKVSDCNLSLWQGVYLALMLTPFIMATALLFPPAMRAFGIREEILKSAIPYLNAIVWSALPLLTYGAFRRYLQGMGLVHPVMFALLSANLVNVAGNWALIFGKWGAPELGVEGAGWATTVSRIYMASVLIGYTLRREWRSPSGLFEKFPRLHPARLRELLRLGLPAASQVTLEVGVFGLATLLAGKLTTASLAAHQIALNCASFTFMVPFGVASAGAVRVGHAIGRRDPVGARESGWTALALGAGFMLLAGALFLLLPEWILRIFTQDAAVIATGVTLLFIAAVFQLFDGIQTVATGILRGAADTRTPMTMNFVGHWLIGLPVGYALCFQAGMGAVGLWTGLSLGLIFVALVLLRVWARKVRTF